MLASLFEQDGDRDIHVYMPYDGLSERELVEDGTFTPEDFFDMDHLSAAGAVKFSGILRGLIFE